MYGVRLWRKAHPHYSDMHLIGHVDALYAEGWQSYGGNWEMRDASIQNLSDDRGARLIHGRDSWSDYIVESDIELLGQFGDAGLLIRTSEEETGVDAYHGYFAGLRDTDETLILGRADYGWHEYQAIPFHAAIYPHRWYHLKLLAYGCTFVAVINTEDGEVRTARHDEPNCIRRGHFGLQSYSTGAAWRHLTVRPASEADRQEMLGVQNRNSEQESHNTLDAWSDQRFDGPMQRDIVAHRPVLNAVAIQNLRLLSMEQRPTVTVDGVVTMVYPHLFLQSDNAGVSLADADMTEPLKIGDMVEATGIAEQHEFSSELHHATVRVLWPHATVSPISVSALQAASGAYDALYIETEGILKDVRRSAGGAMTLTMREGGQEYRAVVENSESASSRPGLEPGSRLRLHGVCVLYGSAVASRTPFAILMQSASDVQVVDPPAWWSGRHLVFLGVLVLLLFAGLQVLVHAVRGAMLHAATEERERLALEMHDSVAQNFAGLGYQLEGICRELPDGSSLRGQLETSLRFVRFSHEDVRRNIAALRPANLEKMSLAEALSAAMKIIVPGGATASAVEVKGVAYPLPLGVSDALLRIGQESIANAIRHAQAKNIQLRVIYGVSTVRLVVRDDGVGFMTSEGASGFGIRGMQRRAAGVGATLRIHSTIGRGTIVSVRAQVAPRFLFGVWWKAAMQRLARSASDA